MTFVSSAIGPNRTAAARGECGMTPEQIAHFQSSDPGIGLFHTCLKAGAPMAFGQTRYIAQAGGWFDVGTEAQRVADVSPATALFAGIKGGQPDEEVCGIEEFKVRPPHVLEVGCCEADWLSLAHAAFPDVLLAGIDWRASNVTDRNGAVTRLKANGLDPDLFPPETFDAIVSLSAIEHFGLGHYAKDPLDPEGDSRIVANCWRWLKPGGWLYFDVPYDPTGYRVQGTECRVYDDAAVFDRLVQTGVTKSGIGCDWLEAWVGYVHAKHVSALIPSPTASTKPFYYCAMVWRKAAAE